MMKEIQIIKNVLTNVHKVLIFLMVTLYKNVLKELFVQVILTLYLILVFNLVQLEKLPK